MKITSSLLQKLFYTIFPFLTIEGKPENPGRGREGPGFCITGERSGGSWRGEGRKQSRYGKRPAARRGGRGRCVRLLGTSCRSRGGSIPPPADRPCGLPAPPAIQGRPGHRDRAGIQTARYSSAGRPHGAGRAGAGPAGRSGHMTGVKTAISAQRRKSSFVRTLPKRLV